MLCAKCEEVDFRFVDELSTSEQDLIKQYSYGDARDWSSEGDAVHFYYFILHSDFAALSLSVQQGCHLCTAIYTAFTSPETWWGLNTIDASAASQEMKPIIMRVWSSRKRAAFSQNTLANKEIYDDIQVWYNGTKRGYRIIKNLPADLAQASQDLSIALYETGSYENDSTTGSSETLSLLKTWLRRCESNHPQCRASEAILPTRLVDVGLSDEAMPPQVKESNAGQEGSYIALSHCWGDATYLNEIRGWTSDISNLPPLDTWPLTFRQAIEVCRSLNIPYLWIDTLCVKQGDGEDFAREAARMAEYYIGATLVIAAVHAKDSRDGCFAARNPILVRPCSIKFRGAAEREIFVSLSPKDKSDRGLDVSPLDSRAWVWQETLLARRSVGFNREQLSWSCILNRAHESRPEGRDINNMHPQSSPTAFLRTFIHHPLKRQGSEAEAKADGSDMQLWRDQMFSLYDMYSAQALFATPCLDTPPRDPTFQKWYDCVEKYTDRNITYATDALPAMSGLAKKMHGALDENNIYHAGLWSGDLIRGLLWAVFDDPDRRKKEESMQYVAPSWSWASRIGHRISYFFDESIMCDANPKTGPQTNQLMNALMPRDIRVGTVLKYPGAKYGEVTSGTLYCKARLLHGCRVTSLLMFSGSSVYGRSHPAYHRGLGGFQTNDHIANWGLVIPAAWAVHESLDKDGKKKAKPNYDKSGPGEIMAELAFDGRRAPSEAILARDPRVKWAEVHVLLLWPFKFKEDRVMGLGLVKMPAGGSTYKRVGRVETVIPHAQLRDWATGEAGLEDITIF